MIKRLGLCIAVATLLLGLGGSAGAQTLQAGAIALTPGATLTADGMTYVASACSYDAGGSMRAQPCATGNDLFMAPVSGPDPGVIIEAATGSAIGSMLVPLLSYTCSPTAVGYTSGSGGTCTTGRYDLSVTLDVTPAVGKLNGASVALQASASPSSLDGDVGGTEVFNSGSLCSLSASAAAPSASCAFAAQGSLSVQKDFGLNIAGIANGSVMTLTSITENFSPAPEPASLTLLLGGLAALGALRWRRRLN